MTRRQKLTDRFGILLLTLAVLLVHGFHPWAEDGGLYVAGVEYKLDPTLFPGHAAFVTEPSRYSIFASFIADTARWSHASLLSVLLGLYLLSAALLLWASLGVARRCFASAYAQWSAVGLLAASWTLPIAGTSLLLMDPYVTARSLSVPITFYAIAEALPRPEPGANHGQLARCAALLFVAALFHPLMAGYGGCFTALLWLERRLSFPWLCGAATGGGLLIAALVQLAARPDSPAAVLAAQSRTYWFLRQWHWYEWMGLLAPLLIFAAVLYQRPAPLRRPALVLLRSSIAGGLAVIAVNLLFAQEHLTNHAVARLQPLRLFLFLYIWLALLLGGMSAEGIRAFTCNVSPSLRSPIRAAASVALPCFVALTMYGVQRNTFPASIHLELPGRANPNPWSRAFLWVRDQTPKSAVFALDARYVNTAGEDAQTFRALAERSAIADFSKDGGEAAIAPDLAPEWLQQSNAARELNKVTDARRLRDLGPLGVDWVVLDAGVPTGESCPYRNQVVKVCKLD